MTEQVVEHKIVAKIFSMKDGYSEYKNVRAIKIISDKYNILIMEDYLPVIGEIKGNVSIVFDDKVEEIPNIRGFYKHSHNEFELLIKEFD